MRSGRAVWCAVALLPAAASSSGAEPRRGIISDKPPFMLTREQLFAWRSDGPLADARNRSRVPLAARFTDPGGELDRTATTDPGVRVLIAPDGMNNFGNYLTPQRRFNLYTFTHWSQVDLLVWFGGTASQPVSIPARPWIEAAHRNGVKVLGTLFFAPRAWGGTSENVDHFLRQANDRSFPAADRLIAIARNYGFDGWIINQETDLGGPNDAATAARMRDFVHYLTRTAEGRLEIQWYDAMLPDGRVEWQNALNARNLPMFQDGGERISDAMFLNYDWTRDELRRSAIVAERNGRSRYDLFIGVDLWPLRNARSGFRTSHWLRDLRDANGKAFGSVALFAPNFNFSWSSADSQSFERSEGRVRDFYDQEVRLFAGDDRNMASGGSPQGSANGQGGIAALVPAKSTIGSLPFETSFNTGHGRHDARNGRRIGGPWHDMSRQEILPTWQFAYTPSAGLQTEYDFERPYRGGSSLRIRWSRLSGPAEVPVFLTRLPIKSGVRISVVSTSSSSRAALRFVADNGRKVDLPLRRGQSWAAQSWCVRAFDGRTIRRISFIAARAGGEIPASDTRLGTIAMKAGCRALRTH